MFSIRTIDNEDYSELLRWWSAWRFPAPPQDCLPNNGTGGIMVCKNSVNIVAGFLYFTNSKLCWMEFIVSNPKYKEDDRKEAIRFLIDELGHIAKSRGFKAVFTSVKNQHLIKHYEDCGYKKGSNNTYEMVLSL